MVINRCVSVVIREGYGWGWLDRYLCMCLCLNACD